MPEDVNFVFPLNTVFKTENLQHSSQGTILSGKRQRLLIPGQGWVFPNSCMKACPRGQQPWQRRAAAPRPLPVRRNEARSQKGSHMATSRCQLFVTRSLLASGRSGRMSCVILLVQFEGLQPKRGERKGSKVSKAPGKSSFPHCFQGTGTCSFPPYQFAAGQLCALWGPRGTGTLGRCVPPRRLPGCPSSVSSPGGSGSGSLSQPCPVFWGMVPHAGHLRTWQPPGPGPRAAPAGTGCGGRARLPAASRRGTPAPHPAAARRPRARPRLRRSAIRGQGPAAPGEGGGAGSRGRAGGERRGRGPAPPGPWLPGLGRRPGRLQDGNIPQERWGRGRGRPQTGAFPATRSAQVPSASLPALGGPSGIGGNGEKFGAEGGRGAVKLLGRLVLGIWCPVSDHRVPGVLRDRSQAICPCLPALDASGLTRLNVPLRQVLLTFRGSR